MSEPADRPADRNPQEHRASATLASAAKPIDPDKPPSPPWYGGIAIGLIALMAAILLTYTLLDWKWQQDLGWWNYVVTIALVPIASLMIRVWRPDAAR